ncbi:hypothetical protein GFH48_04475 [Streptomyces fagopyri]|uniref:Uncharacterized protein n=1 Tax=Streptomyces fagopyri TaxID=2662397 RepID=A0A5Q0L6N5_9ACTN|nr:hypothetical protein GFH48_04475 [Streptomyces fagopyri]
MAGEVHTGDAVPRDGLCRGVAVAVAVTGVTVRGGGPGRAEQGDGSDGGDGEGGSDAHGCIPSKWCALLGHPTRSPPSYALIDPSVGVPSATGRG